MEEAVRLPKVMVELVARLREVMGEEVARLREVKEVVAGPSTMAGEEEPEVQWMAIEAGVALWKMAKGVAEEPHPKAEVVVVVVEVEVEVEGLRWKEAVVPEGRVEGAHWTKMVEAEWALR